MNSTQINDKSLAYIQWSIKTSRTFLLYANQIIFPPGILFNMIVFLIFQRKNFPKIQWAFITLL